MKCQFIVYACPIGQLGKQLEAYFQRSLTEVGANAAHNYMPHCTLTGFFKDEETAIPIYVNALEQARSKALTLRPQPVIQVSDRVFKPEFHYLKLESDWLKNLIADFSQMASSPTRQEPLRLKDWLHLSLAYEFELNQHEALKQIALATVNPQADVEWELRFYERHLEGSWTCHQSWLL